MYKLIVFLLLGFVTNGPIAAQDTAKNASKSELSLRHKYNNKVSRIVIGSKVIVKTPLVKYRGVLLSVGDNSLTIQKRKKSGSDVQINFDSIDVIIKHYGVGYRIFGSVLQVGGYSNVLMGAVLTSSDFFGFEEGLAVVFSGLGAIALGHVLRGRKYYMANWHIGQNENDQ